MREGLVPAELLDPVVAYFRPRRVILFGSRARGEAGPGSDYDVAVFLKHMDNRLAEAYRLADLSVQVFDETGAFIDAKPFRVEEYAKRSPLMHEIRRDGLAL